MENVSAAKELLVPSDAWKEAYPEACVGLLTMRGVVNPPQSPALDEQKKQLELSLHSRFSGMDWSALRADPVLSVYAGYYRRFDKTYHVQGQLESIVFRGKSIPTGAALVEAMFMAELENRLLTAGHDLDLLRPPLTVEVATGSESYTLLRGVNQVPKPGDMMIADREGIVSSVVYGPDQRTQIRPVTSRACFTVYAPPGIGARPVEEHLGAIRHFVELVSPEAQVEALAVFVAD